MKKITIAIDGLSSCGKSTMARQLAEEIGYIYIDTGAMYRAVTLYALQNKIIQDNKIEENKLKKTLSGLEIKFKRNKKTSLPETYLNGVNVEKDIRSMQVSEYVSQIAALDFVREALVNQQQRMGEEKGIVMDGRDIGTTVFPNAELKIFVQASPEVRAKRRYDELQAKNIVSDYEQILANVTQRDEIDMNRAISPLRPAKDALILDNSDLTIEEQNKWLLNKFKEVTS
ncbi:MAG: (d)CMP kinase [Bacteroidales bacterium]|nr:(d)CMP kinase [Bacteroidales bacterium]